MIAVEAAAAITPVGLGLAETAAALYTRVQLLQDLDAFDSDGEPLSGMKIPFADDLGGPARIAAMTHALVDECTVGLEEDAQNLPLILCCAEADEANAEAPARFLAEVIAKAPVEIDPSLSRVIARGRAGVLEGLGAALALLEGGSVRRCLVGGVDSLVDPDRLRRLIEAERLLTGTNRDGFMAGEAGAMLLLGSSSGGLARWLGAAAGNEDATRDTDLPVTGAGVDEAIGKALAQARVSFEALDCIAHDFSGEQRYFEELLLASTRLAKGKTSATVEIPALSVGETGPAAGFLAIALLAFLHSRGVHTRPTLAVTSCDGRERGAVVLGPVLAKGR
jgi:3-oxoacyl-[acyl-carrier-protein] synthase I